MSYHCPRCEGTVLDRTNYICPVCGVDLPPELLFRPPDMPEFDKLAEGKDVQVSLLSRALHDLRTVKKQPQALREAVIRYFRNGISKGFKVAELLEWLFFWPSNRWSVFAQMDFTGKAGHKFVDMVKTLTLRDLGVDDASVAAQASASPNGDPVKRSDNSGVTEVPPSVS